MTAVDELVNRILDREGGIADVGDGKGVTRFGQTDGWLAEYGLPTPRTRQEAAANYVRWLTLSHLIAVVEPTLDDLADIVVDIGVMSHATKAIKALQGVLGQPIDGIMGIHTGLALKDANRRQLARDVIAWDMSYQGRLITQDPVRLARWAAGWANRLAEHVRRLN